MVDQLNSFSAEVTRVAREVGSEGKLGGQATVKGIGGVWKDLTDSVNQMGSNLTAQVRNIAEVTTAVAKGDLSRKITVDVKGEILDLKNTVNTMVDQLNSFASEVTRVALEVGTEGKLGGQAKVQDVGGTWKDLTESVNQMASNLTAQVRNIADVTTAVANGDLSKKITATVSGEILELKNTINTMVDQLNSFASEVTRVALEVGTEGKLGGQAKVQGVGGTWKDLTDSVNQMGSNLTAQVRNIAEVTTAVAKVEVAGESFNLGSPKQIQHIFFDKLGLPVIRKTPKGQPSTAEDVLQEMAEDHELPRLILEHRGMSKLKSTYTDKLPLQINPQTGRVHTSYNQCGAATGRLSSTDPNLQNIPIKTEEGRRIRLVLHGVERLRAGQAVIEFIVETQVRRRAVVVARDDARRIFGNGERVVTSRDARCLFADDRAADQEVVLCHLRASVNRDGDHPALLIGRDVLRIDRRRLARLQNDDRFVDQSRFDQAAEKHPHARAL